MKNYRILLPGLLALYLILTACTAEPGTNGGTAASSAAAAQSSSTSSGDTVIVSDLPEGSFEAPENGNFKGTVYVRGYATVEKVSEPFCDTNCKQYDYAFFQVMESGNAAFMTFIESQQDNAYAGSNPPRIGLGCVDNNLISYENHSDRYGRRQTALSKDLSLLVLQSTVRNPVVLKLDKEQLSAGSGAPACYSHFTDVSQWTGMPASSVHAATECKIAGCSAQLCVGADEDGVSNCEYRAEYACYKAEVCKVQPSGKCGWTPSQRLTSCLEDASRDD